MTLSEHSFCSLIRLNQAKNKLADAFTVFFIIRRITLLKCIVFLLLNGKIEVTVFFFLELRVVFRERFKCDIIMPSIIFSGPIIPYI